MVTITAAPEVDDETAPVGGRLTARLAAARHEDSTYNGSMTPSAPELVGQSSDNVCSGAHVAVGLPQGSSHEPAAKEQVRKTPPPPHASQPPPPKKLSIWKQFWNFVARVRIAMDTPLGRRLVTFFSRCLMALDTVRGVAWSTQFGDLLGCQVV